MTRRRGVHMNRCATCDDWYDEHGPDAAVHRHPEPQSGPYRDAWGASGLEYADWVSETPEGRAWAAVGWYRSMTDRELDDAFACEVAGWDPPHSWRISDWSPPCYSTDIAATLEAIDRIQQALRLDVSIDRGHPAWDEWCVQLTNEPTRDGVTFTARGASLPRAICEAALAAVRAGR